MLQHVATLALARGIFPRDALALLEHSTFRHGSSLSSGSEGQRPPAAAGLAPGFGSADPHSAWRERRRASARRRWADTARAMSVQSTLGLLMLGSLVACAAPRGSDARAAAPDE